MGSVTQVNIINGTDIATAFNSAVDSAADEYGHGGYTGTIAEAGGWAAYSVRPEGISFYEAETISDLKTVKWEEALISTIVDESTLSKTEKKILFNVNGDADYNQIRAELVNEAVLRCAEKNGEFVVVGAKVIDVTKAVTGNPVTEQRLEKFFVVGDGVRESFTEKKLAVALAKKCARTGKRVVLTQTVETVYLPMTKQKFQIEITTRKIIGSTKTVKGQWYAMGRYSE